jgi:hypothetical protein
LDQKEAEDMMRWLGGIFKEALEQVVGEMLQRQLLWRRRGLEKRARRRVWRCGPYTWLQKRSHETSKDD